MVSTTTRIKREQNFAEFVAEGLLAKTDPTAQWDKIKASFTSNQLTAIRNILLGGKAAKAPPTKLTVGKFQREKFLRDRFPARKVSKKKLKVEVKDILGEFEKKVPLQKRKKGLRKPKILGKHIFDLHSVYVSAEKERIVVNAFGRHKKRNLASDFSFTARDKFESQFPQFTSIQWSGPDEIDEFEAPRKSWRNWLYIVVFGKKMSSYFESDSSTELGKGSPGRLGKK